MNATFRTTGIKRARQLLDRSGQTLCLTRSSGASLHGAQGWTVRSLKGAVWITQDGDLRDIVLQPGESFVLDRRSDALLWSLDGDCVSVRVAPSDRRKVEPRRTANTMQPLPA